MSYGIYIEMPATGNYSSRLEGVISHIILLVFPLTGKYVVKNS